MPTKPGKSITAPTPEEQAQDDAARREAEEVAREAEERREAERQRQEADARRMEEEQDDEERRRQDEQAARDAEEARRKTEPPPSVTEGAERAAEAAKQSQEREDAAQEQAQGKAIEHDRATQFPVQQDPAERQEAVEHAREPDPRGEGGGAPEDTHHDDMDQLHLAPPPGTSRIAATETGTEDHGPGPTIAPQAGFRTGEQEVERVVLTDIDEQDAQHQATIYTTRHGEEPGREMPDTVGAPPLAGPTVGGGPPAPEDYWPQGRPGRVGDERELTAEDEAAARQGLVESFTLPTAASGSHSSPTPTASNRLRHEAAANAVIKSLIELMRTNHRGDDYAFAQQVLDFAAKRLPYVWRHATGR